MSQFKYPSQDLVELPGELEDDLLLQEERQMQEDYFEMTGSEDPSPAEVAAATLKQVFQVALPHLTHEELIEYQKAILAQILLVEDLPF